ncbi:hypothetical protein MPTK1_5g12960 [Marchantia polymorpha subsp. ruderalis]|uniref:Uncharacterized protein n=2 Tax=Marchantia polymorpha TaxID=3197 RepID=A0AAF6BHS9_MARPO|nr:hypothetical protein MARPO_0092s0012 [Marchantia polymorpha]BBN11563.1 hypothetical protein Mp_5g12960 [Marchantia polymorpha subsp. ruderalis]|eukprot:PTQ33038.1 hypothetical protein MARPO_0092s0012 [Marchantia polymorpha]
MKDRAVLPQYNNAVPTVSSSSAATSGAPAMMNTNQNSQGNVPNAHCDSVLLDIETGPVTASAAPEPKRWFRSESFTSKTAVFSQLGSAVSSLSNRCRGALLGSSLVTYIHRLPALDKPFDLTEIHPGDPKEGIL